MMPIVGRKQHVDKETGQVVEGQQTPHSFSVFLFLTIFVVMQTGSLFSQTMSAKRTRRLSSSCRWRTRGKTHKPERPAALDCYLDSLPLVKMELRMRTPDLVETMRRRVELTTQRAMRLART